MSLAKLWKKTDEWIFTGLFYEHLTASLSHLPNSSPEQLSHICPDRQSEIQLQQQKKNTWKYQSFVWIPIRPVKRNSHDEVHPSCCFQWCLPKKGWKQITDNSCWPYFCQHFEWKSTARFKLKAHRPNVARASNELMHIWWAYQCQDRHSCLPLDYWAGLLVRSS